MSNLFQSAPRPRDRGDHDFHAAFAVSNCFNPRPGHVTGATHKAETPAERILVSIRAPAT